MEEAKKILAKARKEKLPIVDKDFNLKGLITIKDIEKQIKYPLSAKDEQGRLLCGAAVGITANCLERVDALVKAHVDVVVMDSAHGHSANVIRTVKMVKEKYPDLQVIAGNVATGEAARALIEAGVDAVKAVSYTHLDVYKRQMYVRTKIFVLFHLQILTMNEKYVRIRALYFRRYSFFYSTIRQFCQRFQLRKKE